MNGFVRATARWMSFPGLAVAPIAVGLLACGAAPDSVAEPSPASLARDLTLGAEGADVRAVNDYLTQYGYFPNDKLSHEYPNWRAIVAEGPADSNVFDERSTAAIRKLQQNMGIAVSGIVDEATRKVLEMPRCGVPDGIVPLDPADKFALINGTAFYSIGSTVTYKVTNGIPGQFTQAQAQAIAASAFQTWAADIAGLTFAPTTGSAKITITFGPLSPNVAGQTTISAPSTTTINNTFAWSLTFDSSPNINLQGILMHEIGHALGLHHSSIVGTFGVATMYPVFDSTSSLDATSPDVDDAVAISSKYDTFTTMPGAPVARDISVGADGSIWAVGSQAFGDGFRVLKWDGQTWQPSQGGGKRIAVDPFGMPWLTTANGSIFHATSADVNTGWQLMPGNGADIGVGANGYVWVIGGWCGGRDCPIFKWNPDIQNWDTDLSGGAAVRIAVGYRGVPWVLNSAKHFYRYTTNNPLMGSWELMPGLSDDLAIGPGRQSQGDNGAIVDIDYVWSIGRLSNGQVSLEVWDQQQALGSAPSSAAWVGSFRPCSFDTNSALAVGTRGEPYIACNGGHVIKPTK